VEKKIKESSSSPLTSCKSCYIILRKQSDSKKKETEFFKTLKMKNTIIIYYDSERTEGENMLAHPHDQLLEDTPQQIIKILKPFAEVCLPYCIQQNLLVSLSVNCSDRQWHS
jgi:hypothetical protein